MDSVGNDLERLNVILEDTKLRLGEAFLPLVEIAVPYLITFAEHLETAAKALKVFTDLLGFDPQDDFSKKVTKITKSQKDFQLLRRGRYAEFNLVYDRGTAFGLQSNGRIESILASLPSDVKWSYKKTKEHEAMEKRLLKFIDTDWNV